MTYDGVGKLSVEAEQLIDPILTAKPKKKEEHNMSEKQFEPEEPMTPEHQKGSPEDGTAESGHDESTVGGTLDSLKIMIGARIVAQPQPGLMRYGGYVDIPEGDVDANKEMSSLFAGLRTTMDSIMSGVDTISSQLGCEFGFKSEPIKMSFRQSVRALLMSRFVMTHNRGAFTTFGENGENDDMAGIWFISSDEKNFVKTIGKFVSPISKGGFVIMSVYDYENAHDIESLRATTIMVNIEDVIEQEYDLFQSPQDLMTVIDSPDCAYLFNDEDDEKDEMTAI